MTTKINICTEEWCNLVFEGKNKSYGAYELRQMSSKRRSLALLLSISIFTLGVCAPVLIKSMSHEKKWRISEYNELSNLDKLKTEEIKPPIDLPIPEPRKTIQFTPPVITNNDDISEAPPIIDNLLNSNTIISNTTQEGSEESPPVANLTLVEQIVEPIRSADQMPEFIGGEEARVKFIRDNMRFPSIASEMGISGKVVLQFVVNKDGKIDKITILRGIGGGCDEEAMRVTKLMPPWKPGRLNGKAIPVYFVMPIGFAFQNQ